MIVKDYETDRQTFLRQTGKAGSASRNLFGFNKVLNRPDARSDELEATVDSLADSMAALAMIVKTKTPTPAAKAEARAVGVVDKTQILSF